VKHVPQGKTLLVLQKDLARSSDPRLIVPHLCLGVVPTPVWCEDSLHLEFGKPLHDVAGAPDQPALIAGFGEIIWLQKPVEAVVGFGIIIPTHVGEEELSGGLAGFFIWGIGIARDKDECKVAGHRDTSTLISILTRCS
jgi:hypothetical protein